MQISKYILVAIQDCRHGGSCDRFNLFPQNGSFNNSDYRRWENEITRALVEGRSVGEVTVTFVRSTPGSVRPDALTVDYSIGGLRNRREFINHRVM
ncbi:MAG: DNA/RNA non-specific endonuclease [Fibrobacteres bacterium]|nr:DNA/RNA non-specific endonuclease [Fibrobacterota bacterium]